MTRRLLPVAIAAAALAACSPAEEGVPRSPLERDEARSAPLVYTVSYPLAFLAERIGEASFEVVFPAPAGVDPAHWQPTAEDIQAFQRADRVLLNGAGYAAWTRFASLSPKRLVDTTAHVHDRFVPAGGVTHTHGPAGAHDHGDVASHTWLDPTVANAQARAVAEALTALRPDEATAHEENRAALEADLLALDARLAEAFSGWPTRGVLYSHPVYQYLDARYALGGRSVTWEPDAHPDPRAWQSLAAMLAERPARVMLWEAEPLPETAAELRAMGIEPVVFEHCGSRPAEPDYLAAMQQNVRRIEDL